MEIDELEKALADARKAATEKPGPYGGRYVARRYDRKAKKDVYIVCKTDDPNGKESKDDSLDILCHVRPDACYGIGFARNYVNLDGTIDRSFFERKE